MPKITLNQAEFYYELHGEGHPLVLISGFGADHLFWAPVLPKLARHFQVLVFDNRAIGQTQEQQNFPLTAKIMADDAMALVNALGLKKPHVVGQSMGGTIVQSLAARYAGEISKVAILTSSPKWRQAMLLGLKSIISMRQQDCSFDSIFKTLLAWVHGEAFLRSPEKVAALRQIFINNPYPQSIENMERQYAALVEFDGRPHLKKITAPTLVVSGLEDIIALPVESEAIAAQIPNAKLIALQCGHGITAEIPEQLSKVLIDFLK